MLAGWLTLGRRIALLVVLGLAVVFFLFGYLSLRGLQDSFDRALNERLVAAQLTASHIDNFLELYLNLLNQTASLTDLDLEDADAEPERHLLENVLGMRGGMGSSAFLVSRENRTIWSEPAPVLQQVNTLVGADSLERVLRDGESLVTTALQDGQGGHVLVLMVPVWDRDGGVAGALGSVWDLSKPFLGGFVEAGQLGETGRAEIVDLNGVVLASSDASRVLRKSDHTSQFSEMIKGGRPTVGGCHSCHESGEAADEVLEPDILAFAPLTSAPWGVAIRQLEEEALGPARALQRSLVIASGVAIAVAIWVVWLVTRSVVVPIRELTFASRRIAAGNLDNRVESTGPAEVGDLASAFDEMREQLRGSLVKLEHMNASLESNVEQRTKELSTLLEISKVLASSLDLRQLLDTVVSRTADVLELADAGFVVLYNERTGKLEGKAGWGYDSSVEQLALLPGEGATGRVFLEGTPLLLDTPEAIQECVSALSVENWACVLRMRSREPSSIMSVPLAVQGRVIGAMTIEHYGNGGTFSKADLGLAQALADQAAMAVENARLYQEVLEKERLRGQLLEKVIAAQEDERRRIARELHDDTCQSLAALSISLEEVREGLPGAANGARTKLDKVNTQIRSTLREVRTLALNLRPSMLDDLGLVMAIDWYAKEQVASRGIEVALDLDEAAGMLPPALETVLFRITQEALNNAVKHSGAASASVRLAVLDSRVILEIEDDGLGFDVERALSNAGSGRRLGLHGMMERATLSGGSLRVLSVPGEGTTVRAELPIQRAGGDAS